MNREAEIGLLANLPRCLAQRRIQERDFDPADPESVFQLYLTAYGNEEWAHRAQIKAAEIYVKQATSQPGLR
jgi:hypothetical protein